MDDDPAPAMSDRDIIAEIERRLSEWHDAMLRLPGPYSFEFDDTVVAPINAVLVFIEETRPPD